MQLLITVCAMGLQAVLFGVLLKGLFYYYYYYYSLLYCAYLFVFFFFLSGVLVLEGRKTAFI